MLKNIDWESLINNIICHIGHWEKLVVKIVYSRTMSTSGFYYSKDGNDYMSMLTSVDGDKMDEIYKAVRERFDLIRDELGKDEMLLITTIAEKEGNIIVKYRDIKNGSKIPFDEIHDYIQLNEEDK